MEPIIDLLELGLDGASLRQKALANNIANVNTPDYKRKDVDFISTLKSIVDKSNNQLAEVSHKLADLANLSLKSTNISLKTTDESHLKGANSIKSSQSIKPFKQITVLDTSYRNDGNNVDIDVEMAELAKNNIYYNTLAQQINERFKNLNDVITKGSR